MRFFDPDSSFMEGMRKLSDVIICNVIFCVCCIPVFTVGAALAALHQCMYIIIKDEDEGLIFIDYFKSFKKFFKKATVLWMLLGLIAVILYLYYRAVMVLEGNLSRVYTITFYVLVLLFLKSAIFLFPMLVYKINKAPGGNSLKDAIKSAVIMSFARLNILPFLVIAAGIVLSVMLYMSFGYGFFYLWMVCGFGIVCYFIELIFLKEIGEIKVEQEKGNEDE